MVLRELAYLLPQYDKVRSHVAFLSKLGGKSYYSYHQLDPLILHSGAVCSVDCLACNQAITSFALKLRFPLTFFVGSLR